MGSVCIRWMIRKDLPKVLSIENQCFPNAWTEEEFIRVLRQRNCIGMVAERDGAVVGYMIYELHKSRLQVINFAVDPLWQREKIGTAMVEKLISKLSKDRRNRVILEVSEKNLPAQLFFRAIGFRAIAILPEFYEDTNDDAYQFQLRYSDAYNEVISQ